MVLRKRFGNEIICSLNGEKYVGHGAIRKNRPTLGQPPLPATNNESVALITAAGAHFLRTLQTAQNMADNEPITISLFVLQEPHGSLRFLGSSWPKNRFHKCHCANWVSELIKCPRAAAPFFADNNEIASLSVIDLSGANRRTSVWQVLILKRTRRRVWSGFSPGRVWIEHTVVSKRWPRENRARESEIEPDGGCAKASKFCVTQREVCSLDWEIFKLLCCEHEGKQKGY